MSGGRRSTAHWKTPAEGEKQSESEAASRTAVLRECCLLLAVRQTNLFGAAAFARLCAHGWHGHHGRGGLGVLGVGLCRAVADLFGGRGGRDLHPLAAFRRTVAVSVPTVPGLQVEPQQPGREKGGDQSLTRVSLRGDGESERGMSARGGKTAVFSPSVAVKEVLPLRLPLFQLCQ